MSSDASTTTFGAMLIARVTPIRVGDSADDAQRAAQLVAGVRTPFSAQTLYGNSAIQLVVTILLAALSDTVNFLQETQPRCSSCPSLSARRYRRLLASHTQDSALMQASNPRRHKL
jgi:hypothetical protein